MLRWQVVSTLTKKVSQKVKPAERSELPHERLFAHLGNNLSVAKRPQGMDLLLWSPYKK